MTRRVIRGVLGNFLGTYTSRYTDYDGYWLFGFLVADLGELRIDLLAPPASNSKVPLDVAVQSAVDKFADQMQKAGLVRSQIREAWLTIRKLPVRSVGLNNSVARAGNNVSFWVGTVTDNGRCYEREQIVVVAPHNAEVERRSARTAAPGP